MKVYWRAFLMLLLLSESISAAAIVQETAETTRSLQFDERIVAGGPDDFTTVRHLRLQGSQQAIGRRLAEVVIQRYSLEPVDHSKIQTSQRLEFYQKNYPFHYRRAQGAADAFGLADGKQKDTSLLPYNCPDFGCSVVYYPPNRTVTGNATLSRNYDFPTASWAKMLGSTNQEDQRPNTADPYVIEVYPDQGYASLYLCAYELLGTALDGINSEGLTVALLANSGEETAIPTREWNRGLSELEIVRYLLENCANVDEAREALRSIEFYYFLLPCHYIIGDRQGNSFVWEYSFDLKQRFNIEGHGQLQWVTNHALNEYPSAQTIPANLTRSTFRRFRQLHDEIQSAGTKHSLENIKHANFCVSGNGLSESDGRTLWHAVYDCQKNSLDIDFYLGESQPDNQKRSGYLHFQLNK